ncbi:hypothetical protein OSCT_1508 [Oscillochloris trichoides DG-6]|uniref:Uncharacterized protein n=1 Tax=Oscillochloris trichoides DG-6 TaxID=765420 RepID=E1IDV7_9CHLR|nr:hypothetical protein [Oscillochloris trichoides]EFO80626.1 hypothetical protein OSCT_1508 [Oscillochloris trichoides DG-6]
MHLTPISVAYFAQIVLMTITSVFLFYRSRQPASNVPLLRFSSASFAGMASILAAMLCDGALNAPWNLYARFWIMSLVALQSIPLFGLLYSIPSWDARYRREFVIVLLLSSARLLYEVYWS